MDEKRKQKTATALRYDATTGHAPTVVAKGKGLIAEHIIETAKEADVPVYQDEKLSQQLYNLSLGDEIPPELYHVIAEVLVFISRMDHNRSKP